MNKHAYLIMAHDDWELLEKLLICLDDTRNHIFVHVDKKKHFSQEKFYNPQFARITYIRRQFVSWGGDSMIKVEVKLLEEAYKEGPFDYYHLLSGHDLPIKSQNEINRFFEIHKGKNFIKVDPNEMIYHYAQNRVKEYWFFQNIVGRNEGHIIGIFRRFQSYMLHLQKILKINRMKNAPFQYHKGTNWFSITEEMTKEVLDHKKDIRKYFYNTICADELFLQTIALNSTLKDSIIDDDLREIDWKRGNPYTYTVEDASMLFSSYSLFARKFATAVDHKIIDEIYNHVCQLPDIM